MSNPTPELAGSPSPSSVLSPSLCALRDREGAAKQAPETHGAVPSQQIPDQLVPGAGPQGAAPEPLRESVLRDTGQGNPCTPPPAPASPPEEASPAMPASSTAVPPLKAQVPPTEQGPDPVALPGASSEGLRPRPPGSSAARHDLGHPAKPPRSKATEGPGQEPGGPPSAPRDPSLAKASPDSPKGTSVPEQDDQAPDSHRERPLPADRKLCPLSVDASPLPKRTACPSLQEAMRLIQEEFAFDGYLDNGLEALIMGITGGTTGLPGAAPGPGRGHGGTQYTVGGPCEGGTGVVTKRGPPTHPSAPRAHGAELSPPGFGRQQSLRQEEGLRALAPPPGPLPAPSALESGEHRRCSPTW